MKVVSGDTGRSKSRRERNWSGTYELVKFFNERPVYKVSCILLRKIC